MPISYDITTDVRFKQGYAQGYKEGYAEGFELGVEMSRILPIIRLIHAKYDFDSIFLYTQETSDFVQRIRGYLEKEDGIIEALKNKEHKPVIAEKIKVSLAFVFAVERRYQKKIELKF